MQEPIIARSNASLSRATSSAGNALAGANGFAIIGAIVERSSVSSIAYDGVRARATSRGYGRSVSALGPVPGVA